MTIPIKANRAYPSLPAPGSSLEAHTRLLEALKEAVEIHERRIPNAYLDSFVRLRELIELGIMQARGNQIVLSLDAVLPSNVALYDGDVSQFSNGTFADGRIAESNVTQHQAALVIDWSQLTSVPSIFPPGSHTHSASDITTGTLSDARLSSNVALYDGDVGQFASGTFDDARIAESNVTQHQAALSISWSQLTDVPPIVLESRKIDTGTGLTGGGDLSQDRTIALDATTQSALALATSAVQPGDLAAVATSGDFGDLSDVPAMVSSLASLSDPNADRIVFWDDSAGALAFLEIGTGLEISGTSLQLTSAAQNALTLAATALQPGDNISTLTNDTGYITGIGGFSIGDLADVNIGTPGSGEDGYALVWDNDEGEFVLAPVSGGGGTVTSVAVSVPTGFTVTGSPITSSGTIEIEYDTGYQGFTSAEAALIASAVQPGDLAAVAFSGDYDDLTNVPSTFPPTAHTHNASDINAGTLADARLSNNVALLNRTPQTFTGINIFRSAQNVYGAVEVGASANISLQLGSYETASTDIVSVVNQTTPSGALIRGASQGHLVLALRENDTTDSVSIISGGGNYTSDTTYDTLVAQFLANGNARIGGTLAWGGGDAIASSSLVPLKDAPNVFTVQQTIQRTGGSPTLTVERIGNTVNAVIEAKTTSGSVYFGNSDGSTFAIGASNNLGSSPWVSVSGSEFEVNATTLDFNGNTDISGTLAVGGAATFSAQVAITGTHATDTRIRRGDTTGILRLLGGTDASGNTGGHIALFGADFGGARANGADLNAGTGGIARVQAPGGTVELNAGLLDFNGNVDISGEVVFSSSSTAGKIRTNVNSIEVGSLDTGGGNPSPATRVPGFQITDTTLSRATQSIGYFANNASGPGLVFVKSRGTVVGVSGALQANNAMGTITFAAADGVDLLSIGAAIKVRAAANFSENDTPAYMTFHTTPVGSDAPVERMRIEANGDVLMQENVEVGGTLSWGGGNPIASSDDVADVDSGSFTATLTGVSGTVQGTVNWVRQGNVVTLYTASAITGTSNASTLVLTGLPTALQPAEDRQVLGAGFRDAGGRVIAVAHVLAADAINNPSGIIAFFNASTSGNRVIYELGSWTDSGPKGLEAGWSITYIL